MSYFSEQIWTDDTTILIKDANMKVRPPGMKMRAKQINARVTSVEKTRSSGAIGRSYERLC